MPFIPHTDQEVREMLEAIGVDGIEDLFEEIPADLRCVELKSIPPAMSELEASQLMAGRVRTDSRPASLVVGPTITIYPPRSGRLPPVASSTAPIPPTRRKPARAPCSCSMNISR